MTQSILLNLSKEELLAEVGNLLDTKLSKLDLSPKKEEQKLLTQEETAAFLNVSVPTIIKFKKQGKLTYRKIGKRYYFDREELIKNMLFIEGGVK